jgi:hypothetical protein
VSEYSLRCSPCDKFVLQLTSHSLSRFVRGTATSNSLACKLKVLVEKVKELLQTCQGLSWPEDDLCLSCLQGRAM